MAWIMIPDNQAFHEFHGITIVDGNVVFSEA